MADCAEYSKYCAVPISGLEKNISGKRGFENHFAFGVALSDGVGGGIMGVLAEGDAVYPQQTVAYGTVWAM